MKDKPLCFYSNRLEVLFSFFSEILFSNFTDFFSSRIVVVPSLALRDWLQTMMAKSSFQVCFGVKFVLLSEFFDLLENKVEFSKEKDELTFPSLTHLTLKIENEIVSMISSGQNLNQELRDSCSLLMHYLKIDNPLNPLTSQSQRRLSTLSSSLSQLFFVYGHYGRDAIFEWKENPLNWQQLLWKRIFEKGEWSCDRFWFEKIKKKKISSLKNTYIHLFGLSFLSSLQLQVFDYIAQYTPVYFYVLSPCQLYWHDQRKKLRKEIDFDFHHNYLLANWGSVGRLFAKELEEQLRDSVKAYCMNKNISKISSYSEVINEELILEETSHPISLLEGLQTDLLLARALHSSDKINIYEKELSITVNETISAKREVEVLFQKLSRLFRETDLQPSDVIIMSPDIAKYEAHILQIFNDDYHPLPFHMMDLLENNQNPFLEGFWRLLKIIDSRWEVSKIINLFEHQLFRNAHDICEDSLMFFYKIIKDTEIHWSRNQDHRKDVLKENFSNFDDHIPRYGTWDFGLERVLLGRSMLIPKSEGVVLPLSDMIPYLDSERTQSLLLEKIHMIIEDLKEDLSIFENKKEKALDDWVTLCVDLFKKFFYKEGLSTQNQSFYEDVIKKLEGMRSTSFLSKKISVPFSSFYFQLEKNLTNKTANFQIHELNSIRFCSLQPMRAIPASFIGLLGMNEGDFPRSDFLSTLNELRHFKNIDYFPSKLDLDRYLILEAILSSRFHLYLSYSLESFENKNIGSSSLVRELISYLDQGFIINGKSFSEVGVISHPFTGFDISYFNKNEVKSYTYKDWLRAKAYSQNQSKALFSSFSDLYDPDKTKLEISLTPTFLTIQEALSGFEDPLKLFLEKRLGIFLYKEAMSSFEDEEKFVLSKKKEEKIELEALKKKNFEKLWDEEVLEGKIPHGIFGSVIQKKIQRHLEKKQETLLEMEVAQENPTTFILSKKCRQVIQKTENEWYLPAYSIVDNLYLEGKMSFIFKKGIFLVDSSIKSSQLSMQFYRCLYGHLIELYNLPYRADSLDINGHIISFTKADKESITGYFDLLKCFLLHPSPLNSDLILASLKNDAYRWKELFRQRFEQFPFQSRYFQWVLRQDDVFDLDKLYEFWTPIIRDCLILEEEFVDGIV